MPNQLFNEFANKSAKNALVNCGEKVNCRVKYFITVSMSKDKHYEWILWSFLDTRTMRERDDERLLNVNVKKALENFRSSFDQIRHKKKVTATIGTHCGGDEALENVF